MPFITRFVSACRAAQRQHAQDRLTGLMPNPLPRGSCYATPRTTCKSMHCGVKVRERDKAAAAAERRSGMRANMAFLEQQEADFKSGGQGGIGKYGKKRGGRS